MINLGKIPNKTRQEISIEYGFSVNVLKRKMKHEGIKLPRGLITPQHQKQIYDALGYPQGINRTDYENL